MQDSSNFKISDFPSLLSVFPEDLHHKVPGQQVLGLSHKLAIGSARVIAKAVLACLPHRERNRHVSAFLHHEAGGLEARFARECGQNVRVIDAGEFSDLLLAERFADDHPRIHTNYFPAGFVGTSLTVTACLATIRS